jgi:hypothetical protein
MRLASIALLLSVTGCVPYPIYKTLQPEAKAIVRDHTARPVPGAKVTLIASAYPYGREKSRETKETDASGVASFSSRKEWRMEVLMIHGWEEYFWNWCIEKPGFQTYETAFGSQKKFGLESVFVLTEGASVPCAPGAK